MRFETRRRQRSKEREAEFGALWRRVRNLVSMSAPHLSMRHTSGGKFRHLQKPPAWNSHWFNNLNICPCVATRKRYNCCYHRTMATPTFFVPPPSAEELASILEEEVRRQQELTPEADFRRQDATQSYDYLCEIEHERFSPQEVDLFRRNITESAYWECEARKYKDLLSDLVWQNLSREYCVEGVSTSNSWRAIATAYERRLKRQGYSTQQTRAGRLSIKDQRYWKPEAECLRGVAAYREHEEQEKYVGRKANLQLPDENQLRHPHCQETPRAQLQKGTRRPTRSSRRLQSSYRQTRARGSPGSGLRGFGTSKVEKRCKVGAKGAPIPNLRPHTTAR